MRLGLFCRLLIWINGSQFDYMAFAIIQLDTEILDK